MPPLIYPLTYAHNKSIINSYQQKVIAMKKIEVLYSDSQQLKLSDLMDALGTNKTAMARAAMFLGLQQIQELADRDKESAQELVAVTSFKAKQ